ncbi:MAG: hypothetical protein KatS3mg008_1327 [Acidimicrobiales bacterium]|nr:MAG: hypothetical protein KatS3mg008_1327 [Acidimicrobiales bacterium]
MKKKVVLVVVIALVGVLVVGCASLVGLLRLGLLTVETESASRDCEESAEELVRFAAMGDEREVSSALERGEDPNVRDEHGNTPLACAGPEGHVEVVRMLLEAGADVDTRSREGEPVVVDAAIHCRAEVIGEIVEHEPDRRSLATALAWSTRNGDADAVKLLLEAGAEPGAFDEHTAVIVETSRACETPSSGEWSVIYDALLEKGADPDSVLSHAVATGTADGVKAALAAGADPETRVDVVGPVTPLWSPAVAEQGLKEMPTALVVAVSTGRGDIASLLVEAGADPDRESVALPFRPTGWTRRSDSCAYLECDAANQILLRMGAGAVQPPALPRVTPLMEATFAGDVLTVRMLLEAGADPNRPAHAGLTPLHAAAASGSAEVVDALFEAGAAPPQSGEWKPSEVAERSGHRELAAKLRERGA